MSNYLIVTIEPSQSTNGALTGLFEGRQRIEVDGARSDVLPPAFEQAIEEAISISPVVVVHVGVYERDDQAVPQDMGHAPDICLQHRLPGALVGELCAVTGDGCYTTGLNMPWLSSRPLPPRYAVHPDVRTLTIWINADLFVHDVGREVGPGIKGTIAKMLDAIERFDFSAA